MRHSDAGSLLLIGPKTPMDSISVPGKPPFDSTLLERISLTIGLACPRKTLSAELLVNRPSDQAPIL